MKKILSLGLVVIMLFALVACTPKGYFDIEDKVKQDYIDTYTSGDDGTTIYDIKINSFYGIYDGSFVAIFHQRDKGGLGISYTINLGGVEFSLPHGDYIRVWKNNKFYEAEEAYEKELLTLEDVKTIHSLYTADSNNEYNRFYGSYNGANVYYQVNEDKMPKTVEIADEEFKFIEGGDIIVHKGNNTYILEEDIDEILSGNILKEKNITTIKSIHDKLNQDQELYEFKVQTIDQIKSLVEEKDTANYSEQSIRLFANAISAFSSCTNNAFTKGEVDWIKEIFETLINETPTVDFEKEMLFVWIKTFSESTAVYLQDVKIENGIIKIDLFQPRSSVWYMSKRRIVVVKTDKVDVSSVEFNLSHVTAN